LVGSFVEKGSPRREEWDWVTRVAPFTRYMSRTRYGGASILFYINFHNMAVQLQFSPISVNRAIR
jgi:hypothetical protein